MEKSPSAHLDVESLMGSKVRCTHWRNAYDEVNTAEREELWRLKSSLDKIDGTVYIQARDLLFPLAVSGSQGSRHLGNRAGYKLSETMAATGMWIHFARRAKDGAAASAVTTRVFPLVEGQGSEIPKKLSTDSTVSISGDCNEKSNPCASGELQSRKRKRTKPLSISFVDICGGPGAFSQALLSLCHSQNVRFHGFGMTLANVEGLDWYQHLLSRKNFTVTYGLDGRGDIYKLENINALCSLTKNASVQLAVADGGFDIPFSIANYQEPISARIVYGQWLCALKVLSAGGCFVLKLFDTFTPFSRSLLYLSTFAFERVHVVKPKHSRVVNSERYLACLGFRSDSSISPWIRYLEFVFETGFEEDDAVPTVIPDEWVKSDTLFMESLVSMNTEIALDQCLALQAVLHSELVVSSSAACLAPEGSDIGNAVD